MTNVLARDSEAQVRVISTGNAEIDKKLGGGIPIGSLTLIEGQSDAGKSVLTHQLTWGSLLNGYRVVVYTSESLVRPLLRQMANLSLDVQDYFLLGWLKIYPIQVAKHEWHSQEVFETLLRHMERLQDYPLMIVDSLTAFVTHATDTETISFFEECKELCNDGRTIVTTVHSYAFPEQTLLRIRSMCDAHLRLRIEQVGDQLVKVLEVAKVRGADQTTGNIISFEVEPRMGMRIIPISKAKA